MTQFIILRDNKTRSYSLYELIDGNLNYIESYYTLNVMFLTVYSLSNNKPFNIRFKNV